MLILLGISDIHLESRTKDLHPIESTELAMRHLTTRSKRVIRQAIDFLIGHRRPITIALKAGDVETLFDSVIVKAEHGDPFLAPGVGGTCCS